MELIKRLDPGRIKFIFVGEGRSQECWTTRSLGFEAQVYERIPYRLFGDLYRAIDVLLMVSRYEGGPANIPEAVASGTPVVGIPVGLMNDMIEPGVNGIYLTGHPSVDAEEILNLAKPNNLLLSKLKEGAKSCRSKAIPWSETVMRNVAIYREIATELETGDQISDEIKSIALAS